MYLCSAKYHQSSLTFRALLLYLHLPSPAKHACHDIDLDRDERSIPPHQHSEAPHCTETMLIETGSIPIPRLRWRWPGTFFPKELIAKEVADVRSNCVWVDRNPCAYTSTRKKGSRYSKTLKKVEKEKPLTLVTTGSERTDILRTSPQQFGQLLEEDKENSSSDKMAVNKYKNNEVIFMESSVRYETTKFFQNKNVVVWRFRIKKGQPFVNIELEHGTTGGKRNFLVGGYVVKSYKDFMNSEFSSVGRRPFRDCAHGRLRKAVYCTPSTHQGTAT